MTHSSATYFFATGDSTLLTVKLAVTQSQCVTKTWQRRSAQWCNAVTTALTSSTNSNDNSFQLHPVETNASPSGNAGDRGLCRHLLGSRARLKSPAPVSSGPLLTGAHHPEEEYPGIEWLNVHDVEDSHVLPASNLANLYLTSSSFCDTQRGPVNNWSYTVHQVDDEFWWGHRLNRSPADT